MPNFAKQLMAAALHYSGFNRLCGGLLSHQVFLLGYHSVCDATIEEQFQNTLYPDLSISVNQLAEQIEYLKKNGHTFTSFKNLASVIASGAKKPTIIFFDDGFKDNLYNAAPLLQQYGIAATVFVTTGFIDRTHFALTSYYRYLLQCQSRTETEITQAVLVFKKKSYVDRQRLIDQLKTELPQALSWSEFSVFLNWEEIKKLAVRGWEIGSHGVSHTKVTECSEDVLDNEVLQSKQRITTATGESVGAFSYPHGRFNDLAQTRLAEAGYDYAVSTQEGTNSFRDIKEHPFALKKIAPRVGENISLFTTRLYAHALFKKI